jgi:hypothetical protein
MRPFNLAEALAGATVVQRDGTAIVEWHHFAASRSVVAVGRRDGGPITYSERGSYWGDGHKESALDLMLSDPPAPHPAVKALLMWADERDSEPCWCYIDKWTGEGHTAGCLNAREAVKHA